MEPALDTTVENFEFWMPISKSEVRKDAKTGTEHRYIEGIASTSHKDLQGEIVDQAGIDVSYFMEHGYFNNDHKPGFENKVGWPTKAQVRKDGLYVEGRLFDKNKVADDIWNMMNSIDATDGAERNVGFSVQGKVKRRVGNKIVKCWVQDVAITPAPINTNTWAQIRKSLYSQEWEDEKDKEDEQEKALTAGYSTNNQTGGAALRPESLEGASKVVDNPYSVSLSKAETVAYIQLKKGYSRAISEGIADVVFRNFAVS